MSGELILSSSFMVSIRIFHMLMHFAGCDYVLGIGKNETLDCCIVHCLGIMNV